MNNLIYQIKKVMLSLIFGIAYIFYFSKKKQNFYLILIKIQYFLFKNKKKSYLKLINISLCKMLHPKKKI